MYNFRMGENLVRVKEKCLGVSCYNLMLNNTLFWDSNNVYVVLPV